MMETGEMTMSDTIANRVNEQGVRFSVAVGFSQRECVVSRDALMYLSMERDPEADLADIYHRNEDRIYRTAQRLVVAGAKESPLVLNSWAFR
jgi:hypothetical protein